MINTLRKMYEKLCKNAVISIFLHTCMVSFGIHKYKAIRKKYGENIIFNPYPNSGDTYLSLIYLEAYLKKNHITEYCYLCRESHSNMEVISMFSVQNIVGLKVVDLALLQRAYCFLKEEKFVIASPFGLSAIYDVSMAPQKKWLINYAESFWNWGYDLPENVELKLPAFSKETEIKLKEKSIILFPYAQTTKALERRWWNQLADELLALGYILYTNTNCDEDVIRGSNKLFFSYKEAEAVLRQADGVIALRSGFCDIVSSIPCAKIVLYTTMDDIDCHELFGLKAMKLDSDVIEIDANSYSQKELLHQVLCKVEEMQTCTKKDL